jgi:hypothetical protein
MSNKEKRNIEAKKAAEQPMIVTAVLAVFNNGRVDSMDLTKIAIIDIASGNTIIGPAQPKKIFE